MFRYAAVLLSSTWAVGATAQPTDPLGALTPDQVEKLFRDVELPPGDPNPDFVDRPWVPPTTDQSAHNKRGTEFGPCIGFSVQIGPKAIVRRGLTVRLPGDRAILYDLDTLSVVATWANGFIDLSKTHFEDAKGQLPGRPAGEPTVWVFDEPGWADADGSFADPREGKLGPLPAEHARYFGHFLYDFRTVLSYQVNGRAVLETPGVEGDTVTRSFHVAAGDRPIVMKLADEPERAWTVPASAEPLNLTLRLDPKTRTVKAGGEAIDPRRYVRGGPARWGEAVVTRGEVGTSDGPYVVDTLTLPEKNPFRSWLRPAAHDFLPDGTLVVSSMNGDVWTVSDIDDGLGELTWKRFATGLYEPLGLKVIDGRVMVLGRDRITRLHDLNLDGEADYYESFFAGGSAAPGYHAFCFDLQTDSRGNFYFLRSGRKVEDSPDYNSLVRVSADGSRAEVVATGFRHPNGMGIGPDDQIVVGDNQGEYVPASKLSLIRPGGFYGYRLTKDDTRPFERPLLWLPMSQDNSSGGQVWAPDDWGPLSGRLLHTSYGSSKLFYVLSQFEDGGPIQASAVPLDELKFLSGIMRARFSPEDGHLYVSGLKGWGTNAERDGCLHRVRHTGGQARMVEDVRIVPGGLELSFTCELDGKSAGDPKNYRLEQWNYIYSEKYGSPEMSVRNPTEKGHDELEVSRVTVAADGRSVRLDVPGMVPVDQLWAKFDLKTADGATVGQEVFATVHRVVSE